MKVHGVQRVTNDAQRKCLQSQETSMTSLVSEITPPNQQVAEIEPPNQ